MGKIVMPKNSALLNEIEAVLQIYYNAKGWLSNDDYKQKLKEMIGDDQYASSYTKKSQITSYFGFTEWEDISNKQSKRRITTAGKKMYEALVKQDYEQVQESLMNALETVKFGRNNYGCPDSNSDIEPPSLYIRAILDMGYLTYKEFAYLLWKLEDVGANYTDTLNEVRVLREQGTLELEKEAEKYADCKIIMVLVRWGFLAEADDSSRSKRIIIPKKVLEKYESRLRNLKIYNIDMDCDNPIVDNDISVMSDSDKSNYDFVKRVTTGCNILLYGVPGCGKSWTIDHEYCKQDTCVERIVFHPDYTNADFVGQLLPVIDEDKQVVYEFVPGPFTNILLDAYTHPMKEYVLIIEEINRGNAPAIFGDIFQLLDRHVEEKIGDISYPSGTSKYGIINANIAKYVYGDSKHEVRIPSNLSILGTMNTSDQNVFTLDTAFQRRWKMRLIENNFDNVRESLANAEILDTGVTWEKFCTVINDIIVRNKSKIMSAEDKRLGVYFVHENDLKYDDRDACEGSLLDEYNQLIKLERSDKMIQSQTQRLADIRTALMQNRIFPEKVIKYLWDDAFKFMPEAIFDTERVNSLEDVIRIFIFSKKNERFNIFKKDIRDSFYF